MVRLPPASQQKMLDMKFEAKFYKEATGQWQNEMMIGKNNTSGVGMGVANEAAIGQAKAEYNKGKIDLMGAELKEKTIDLAGYAKAKRDAIYSDTFGFKMEERTSTSNKYGITTKKMVETRETLRIKKATGDILGPGFRLNDAAGQEAASEEIDRLILSAGGGSTGDMAKLTKIAKLRGKEDARYFTSKEFKESKAKERAASAKYDTADALEFRTGQADKFADYLYYNLRKTTTPKQDEAIKGVFTGKTKASDLGAGVIDLLAEGSGLTSEIIKGHISAGTLTSTLGKTEAVMSKNEVSEIEKASLRLVRAQAEKTRTESIVKVGGKKEDIAAAEGASLDLLKQQREYDKLTQSISVPDSSRGKESYASVQPPILNYWNNKWTL